MRVDGGKDGVYIYLLFYVKNAAKYKEAIYGEDAQIFKNRPAVVTGLRIAQNPHCLFQQF
jgi:hypothetical protein